MSGKNTNCVDYVQGFTNKSNKGCNNNKVQENFDGIGKNGGTCRCPDGEEYEVGENESEGGVLACENGVSDGGIDLNGNGAWSHRKVICELDFFERIFQFFFEHFF